MIASIAASLVWSGSQAVAADVPAACPADAAALSAKIDEAPKAAESARAAAWYGLAPCLLAAGQPHLAARAWARGIDEDGKRAGAGPALSGIAAVTATTGNDTTLLAVASFLPENLRAPEVAALLDLASARDLTVAGSRVEAMEKLKKVPPGGAAYVEAQYRLGRLQWELGKKDDAKALFSSARGAPSNDTDPFVKAQVARWQALSALAIADLTWEADPKAGADSVKALDGSSLPARWTQAWLTDSAADRRAFVATQTARKVPPFVPDAPMLLAGSWLKDRAEATDAIKGFETTWGPVRDELDGFLNTWQSKPTDAWTAWRTAPANATLQADLSMNARTSAYTRDLGLLALEETAIPTTWTPTAQAWAHEQFGKLRAETTPRAGRALIGALQNRQERLYTLTSQAKKLTAELPTGTEDPEILRGVTKPLPFLATDWGL